MKRILVLFILYILGKNINAQSTRLAILDFENISGITKYDGLGKAMSSMLISDIEANVSPKRLQLVERAQIQKILKEQKFQTSGSVNENTAVQAGKLLGVNYLLIGDVYLLNDELIINARLTNTETGDIIFSKKQEGKTVGWLTLKTNIAKDLATSLTQPFTEPTIPDKEIPMATITTFSNAVSAKDIGDIKKSENLIETIKEYNPDFKYLDDLTKEIEEIKKTLDKVENDIKVLEKSGGRVINSIFPKEIMNNMTNPNASYNDRKLELEKLLTFPLDSIKYIYGKYYLNLASFYSYPASMDGYRDICSDIDFFIADLQFLLKLSGKNIIIKASLVYFIECKLDYLSGDISEIFPDF